ncbi:MAG: UPF0182 family protein [Dermatophilaceae bacterium]
MPAPAESRSTTAVKRLAYGVKYREINFLLSDTVNASSRLLDYRTPRERVARVAPWLTLDGNAYPSIVDGRIVWIIDGYTTTASYPILATEPDDAVDLRLGDDARAQCLGAGAGAGQLHPQLGQGDR